MAKKLNTTKLRIIQAALEDEGLDNPVDVVTIIKALSAVIAAVKAFQDIRKIIKEK